jgi:lysine 2,3-aminomutase
MFCTRSYAVGADTDTVPKSSLKPIRRRWEEAFAYIKSRPGLHDIVVSGGDSYYLSPEHITLIGERLISIPNIRRFRFATKGLAVAPTRILDGSDGWVDALIQVSNIAKKAGKVMAVHTHFNHPSEISWITRLAAQKLLEAGVTVRNQSVLLKGVNDDIETMGELIRNLAGCSIFPVSGAICLLLSELLDPLASTYLLLANPPRKNKPLTRSNSTTSTNVTWSPKPSISALPSRPSSTSSPRSEAPSPAS